MDFARVSRQGVPLETELNRGIRNPTTQVATAEAGEMIVGSFPTINLQQQLQVGNLLKQKTGM